MKSFYGRDLDLACRCIEGEESAVCGGGVGADLATVNGNRPIACRDARDVVAYSTRSGNLAGYDVRSSLARGGEEHCYLLVVYAARESILGGDLTNRRHLLVARIGDVYHVEEACVGGCLVIYDLCILLFLLFYDIINMYSVFYRL